MVLLVVLEETEFGLGLSRRHLLEFVLGVVGVPRRNILDTVVNETLAEVVLHVVLFLEALDSLEVDGQSHLETADRIVGLDLAPVRVAGLDVERVVTVFTRLQLVLEVGTSLVLFDDGEPKIVLLLHLHIVSALLHRGYHLGIFTEPENDKRQFDGLLVVGGKCEVVLSEENFRAFHKEVHVVGEGDSICGHDEIDNRL